MTGSSSHIRRTRLSKAIADVEEGLRRWELWGTMGLHDIKQRYRRSVIGPFWLTLSMGIMIGTLGFLYSSLFGQSVRDYLPFLALGLIVWNLISNIVLEGCTVFIAAEGIIRHLRTSMSNSKVLLSINHEANEFTVGSLATGISRLRFAYWLREGYVEELYWSHSAPIQPSPLPVS